MPPSPREPERARFARIILAPTPGATLDLVKIAALGLRAALFERSLQAVAGLDPNGAVLWIPFDDLPHYDTLRAWLHTIADAVIAAHPNVFTHHRDPERIRIDVGSNAVGHFSAPPAPVTPSEAPQREVEGPPPVQRSRRPCPNRLASSGHHG